METQTENKLTEVKKDISTQVLAKVDEFQKTGQLSIPKDYSPENALKAAYIVLSETKNGKDQKALEKCTKSSVANALLKMVVWGLNPIKSQCYFIMYGDKLECVPDYSGNIAMAKRYGGLKHIKANAIFKDDVVEITIDPENGTKKITKHTQTIDSLGSNTIKGAYAVFEMEDGRVDTEIMNINQIETSWAQGGSNGNSPAHKKFPDQMAIKTVINRACKLIIRSSDDSVLYADEAAKDRTIDVTAEEVDYEINEKANKQTISMDIDDAEIVEDNDAAKAESAPKTESDSGQAELELQKQF